jgi:hypothetical protein
MNSANGGVNPYVSSIFANRFINRANHWRSGIELHRLVVNRKTLAVEEI